MAFITAETRSSIVELAMGMLNQAPSTTLLSTLIEKSTSGSSTQDLADYIATTDAFTAEYPATQTAREFATEMFGKLITGGTLDADINTAVIDLLEGLLIAGTTKAQGFVAVIEFLANPANADHPDLGDIAQSFQNRADAAEYFVVTKELGGSTDAELAAAIASVTSDAATLTAANTAADATASVEEVVAGQTFTLTTGVDAITGSAGSDTFNGVVQANGLTGSTTSPGDVVTGGAGTDTLSISVAGDGTNAGYTLQAVQSNAVENIHVTNFDTNATGTTTVDTSLMSGVESVGIAASSATGATTFSNLTAIKDAKMMNGSADLTLTYVAGTTGTADVQNLAVSAVSAGTFSANGVETVAVTSSLTANKLTNITGSSLKAITVAGDQNFTMTGASTVKGIDTSANTGKASLVLGAATHTVTTGAGDDTVDIGANLNYLDKIQGGEGTDTIKVTSATAVFAGASSAIDLEEFTQSGGFEIIDLSATGGDLGSGGTAGVELAYLPDVTKVVADSHVRVVDLNASTIGGAAGITFVLNGTTYTTATPAAGTAAAGAAAVAATIDALTGFTAAVTNTDDVTITRTGSGSVINIGTFGGDLSGTAPTIDAVGNVVLTKMDDEVVDIYTAGSVSARLTDSSGTSDSMTVNLKSNLADRSLAQTVDTLDVAGTIETLNLDATGMKTGVGALAIQKTLTTLTADNALTTLNLTGSDKLTIGTITAGKLATIDASATTGDVSIPSNSGTNIAQTITMGSGNDTLVMGAQLSAADVIDMGANKVATATGALGSDTLTATGNQGTTVASAALNLSNVEKVQLSVGGAAASYIDGSKLTNVGEIAFSSTAGPATFTNMPAGTAIGLGIADVEGNATITYALADATGTEDALSLNYSDTLNAGSSNTLVTAGIETLNVSAEKAGSNTSTLVNTAMTASTINVTAGVATNTVALGTLNKATTSVVNTGKSIVTFTSATGVAMDATASAAVINNITLSTKADTVTLSGVLGSTTQIINGGGGTGVDTLNTPVTATDTDFATVTGFEVINLTVPAATATGFDNAAEDTGLNQAALVNILGGNSASSFTIAGAEFTDGRAAATALTVDASTFAGSIAIQFASDALDMFTTVKGGASASDAVSTIINAVASATVGNNPTMSGVETLTVTSTDTVTTAAMNLAKVTGLTKLNATFTGATADGMAITGLAAGVPVYANSNVTADKLVLGLASSKGLADALSVVIMGNTGVLDLDAAGIETLNLVTGLAGGIIDLAGVAPTATGATTVNISGAAGFTLNAINTGITNINGSSMGGALTVAAAQRDSDAITITGGVNSDSIAMESAGDVLDGGAQPIGGQDTLTINFASIMGGITVDLSAADQIPLMDGSPNTAIQTGFEDVDLSSYTNAGAVVTGTATGSTIVGTASADRITGGKSADNITGGAGGDQINGAGGNDTIVYKLTADLFSGQALVDSSLVGGTGTDILEVGTSGTAFAIAANDAWTGATTVETIKSVANTVAVTIDLDVTAYAAGIRTVDTSLADSGNNGSNIIDASEFTGTASLTLIGPDGTGSSAITGGAGDDTITGGAGIDTIIGGAGVDTITGGAGADVIDQTYTDIDTTAGAVTDIIIGFATGSDTIKTGTAGGGATYLEAGAAVADLATLLTAAGTGLDGTVKIYVGQVGADSYAVLDDDGTGYSSVIKLSGVALTAVAATDFVV